MNKVVSNQLSDEVLVGDFKHLLMGIYKNITLDFSTTDADSWNNYGASFRVVARVDFAVTNKDAFVLIDGVTEATTTTNRLKHTSNRLYKSLTIQ